MRPDEPDNPYVGRGGLKLRHALDVFGLDVRGMWCADFGCNVGGFTDCLLKSGADRVWAVDTGYGTLDYRLRTDPRVTVMERTNALHADPPAELRAHGADLVVIDMGWTPQRRAIPAALRWLREGGRIVTLIKPHYELGRESAHELGPGFEDARLIGGVLDDETAERVAKRVAERMPDLGARALGLTRSPIRGGATKGNSRGNAEWLAIVVRA